MVWVDEGGPQYKAHTYLAWCYWDMHGYYRLFWTFDVLFDGVSEWDLMAIPSPDGEVTSLDTILEDSYPQPVIIESNLEEEFMESEPTEEPEEIDPKLEPMESDPKEEPMELEFKEEPKESDPKPIDKLSESLGSNSD